MDAILKTLPYTPEYVPVMIGQPVITLFRTDYDPAQGWFDFMRGATIPIHRDQFHQGPAKPPVHKAAVDKAKFARMSSDGRQPFVYRKGFEQITLPFREFRKLSNKAHARAISSGYAGWEKTEGGQPHRVDYLPNHAAEVAEWCLTNCFGRFHCNRQYAVFELAKDATMVKIIWQRAAV